MKDSSSKVNEDVSKRILEQEKFIHKAVFSSDSLQSAHNYVNNNLRGKEKQDQT